MTEPGPENRRHAHRHALHALEDLEALALEGELAHSLSHHLRHAVYRTGVELGKYVRARDKDSR